MPAAIPYREAIGASILRRLTAGESLDRICGKDGVPTAPTVKRWAALTPHFARRLRLAREAFGKLKLARRRPQAPSPDLATEICARIEAGETLTNICRGSPHMPLYRVARPWLTAYPDFARRYHAALERKAAQRPYLPRRYSEAIAAEICKRLAAGESMNAICRDPQMPCHQTVIDWRKGLPRFDHRLREAADPLHAAHRPLPRLYDRTQVMAAICERLAAGEPLKAICRSPGMPCEGSVLKWLKVTPWFASRYALARDEGQELRFDMFLWAANAAERGGAGGPSREELRRWARLVPARKYVP